MRTGIELLRAAADELDELTKHHAGCRTNAKCPSCETSAEIAAYLDRAATGWRQTRRFESEDAA